MNAKIDLSDIVLKTERLILRPFRLDDLDDFYHYASVPGVGEMAGWQHHQNKEESLTILNRFIDGRKTFAIEYDNKVIGSLGIEEYDEESYPEFEDQLGRSIGYILAKEYWGQGLMTEAVKAVINYCFDELDLDFLEAGYFSYNKKSARVLEKCGFLFYSKANKMVLGKETEAIRLMLINTRLI
ncbi:MAG: GNAT family N-acetyltransferase [Acholeplasmataceae bacterium]|jgi:ribosomal-protein-alanine N-acetyltransferase